jgi:hypothetical protein
MTNILKNRLSLAVLAGLATLVGFTGCNTFASRARERSETFESLPPNEQQRLQRGVINVGDTEDMVYIALGRPDERRTVSTADGTQNVWSYRTYWQQYEGTNWAGYRRIIVPAPNRRGFVIYHEPVTYDVYSNHVDETIRVTLNNGVVSTVEQSQRR